MGWRRAANPMISTTSNRHSVQIDSINQGGALGKLGKRQSLHNITSHQLGNKMNRMTRLGSISDRTGSQTHLFRDRYENTYKLNPDFKVTEADIISNIEYAQD